MTFEQFLKLPVEFWECVDLNLDNGDILPEEIHRRSSTVVMFLGRDQARVVWDDYCDGQQRQPTQIVVTEYNFMKQGRVVPMSPTTQLIFEVGTTVQIRISS